MTGTTASIQWIGCVILILMLFGDLCFRLFWLRPRYEEYLLKYGTDCKPDPVLFFQLGRWYRTATSSRQNWRRMITITSAGDVIGILFFALLSTKFNV
jgi:hypothetical protein